MRPATSRWLLGLQLSLTHQPHALRGSLRAGHLMGHWTCPGRQHWHWPHEMDQGVMAAGPYSPICQSQEKHKTPEAWGTWVAQSVECPTSAQVMISQFVSSSPTSGCLLSAQSPLQILCPPLSVPLPHS